MSWRYKLSVGLTGIALVAAVGLMAWGERLGPWNLAEPMRVSEAIGPAQVMGTWGSANSYAAMWVVIEGRLYSVGVSERNGPWSERGRILEYRRYCPRGGGCEW